MVSSVTRFIFGLSSVALLAPVSHARSFARDFIVPTDLPGAWTSMGCYVDIGRTLVNGGFDDELGMTNEECVNYCSSAGYHYAGTEYFHECFCGDVIATGAGPANNNDCSTPCAGDPTQACGGPNRLSLFWDGQLPPSIPSGENGWSFVGCYTEGLTGRALGFYQPLPEGTTNSVDACSAACAASGYVLSGVEFGDECYCGNDVQNSAAPAPDGSALCNMVCPGNSEEYCGGPDRVQLYELGNIINTVAPTSTSSSVVSTSAPVVSTSSSAISTSSPVVSTSSSVVSASSSDQSTAPSTVPSTAVTTSSVAPTSTSSSTSPSVTSSPPGYSAPPTTLKIKPIVSGSTYIGCYTEGQGVRALSPGVFIDYEAMTLEECANACSGYTFWGVEYFGECYCADSIDPTAGLAPNQDDCNFPCPGDASEYCGAGNRIDMYMVGVSSGTTGSSTSSSATSSSSVAPTAGTSTSSSATTSSSADPSVGSTSSSSSSSSDLPTSTSSSSSLAPSSTSSTSSSSSVDPTSTSSSSSSSVGPTSTSASSSSSVDPTSTSSSSSSSVDPTSTSSSSSDPSTSSSAQSSSSSSSPSSSVSVCSPSVATVLPAISLGQASTFAALSYASITNTGPSVLNGDIGTTGTSITGFPPGVYSGAKYISTAASAALTDAKTAYNNLVNLPGATVLTGNLAGKILAPGTYKFTSSANLAAGGALTLAGTGSSSDAWYFQIGSTLVTGAGSEIDFTGGAQANQVFWQVGSSATLGVGSDFEGTLLAAISVTVGTAATVHGGVFGLGGSVTIQIAEIDSLSFPTVVSSIPCTATSTSSSSPSSSSSVVSTTASDSSTSSSTSSSAAATTSSSSSSSVITTSSSSSSSSVITTSSTSSSTTSTTGPSAVSSCSSGPRPSNIIPNPSFEDSASNDWHFVSGSVVSTESISGSDSAALEGNDGDYSIVYNFIPYTSDWGETLYMSFAAKYSGPSDIGCRFEAMTGSNTIQDFDAQEEFDWQYFTGSYNVPDEDYSEGFAIAFMCPDTTARLYIDDVYFGPVATAPQICTSATSSSSSSAPSSTSSSAPSSTSSSDPSSTSSSAPSSTSSSDPSSTSSSAPSSTSASSAPSSTSSSDPSSTSSSDPTSTSSDPSSTSSDPTSTSSSAPSSTSSSSTSSSSPSPTSTAYVGPPTPSIVPSALDGSYAFIGCYSEATNGRALNLNSFFDYNGLTVEECANACSSFPMFGVEYSGECYCGDALQPGSVVRPYTECDMVCDGAHLELCGGPDRLLVYSAAATTLTTPTASTSASVTSATTAPTTTSSSAPPDVGVYSYYGCQTEGTFSRALSSKTTAYDGMTVESCESDCQGYTYFGVEYGRECYCGNSFSQGSVAAPPADCYFPCAGNGKEICGAGLRLSVYSTSAPAVVSGPSNPATVGAYDYYGCTTEGANSRALYSKTTAYDGMTLQSCAADCDGYTYFGTEYSRECYCGNDFAPGAVPAPEIECQNTNFLCMGNHNEFCGGSRLLSVYKLA